MLQLSVGNPIGFISRNELTLVAGGPVLPEHRTGVEHLEAVRGPGATGAGSPQALEGSRK